MAKGNGSTRSVGSGSASAPRKSGGETISGSSRTDSLVAIYMNIEAVKGASIENAVKPAMQRAANTSITTTYFNDNELFTFNGDRFEIQSRKIVKDEALSRRYDAIKRSGRSTSRSSASGERFTTVMSGSLSNTDDVRKATEYIRKNGKR